MILFIGIQATGKSSFYREHFFRTHVRVNLDMLKTRRREELLIRACLEGKTKFVIENTNLTREVRAGYIRPAKEAGFDVIGYFFQSRPADAVRRNAARPQADRVPAPAIWGANRRLALPSRSEGFDRLYRVQLLEPTGFAVQEYIEDLPESGR